MKKLSENERLSWLWQNQHGIECFCMFSNIPYFSKQGLSKQGPAQVGILYILYNTYTMYTIYTTYTMLTKVANPFEKPHKTKQKWDSREAIATPLRKHTTKQNEKSVQGWSGSKRKSSCPGQPLSYYRVLFLFLVETCKNSKEDNISAIKKRCWPKHELPSALDLCDNLVFLFLRSFEAHIMSSCSQDFRKESLRI